ncbi:MAG: DUF1080 domain-containing protein [Balneolales bacterium]
MKKYNYTRFITLQLFTVTAVLVLTGCNGQENSQSINEVTPEFNSIFNGSDLANWDGDSRFWSVEDGVIVGETSKDNATERNTFLIWEGEEPSDFELRFRYKFVEVGDELSGNSGIQVRSERFVNEEEPQLQHRVRGYQPDFSVTEGVTGNLYDEAGGLGRIVSPPGQRILLDSEGNRHVVETVDDGVEWEKKINHTNWNDFHVYAKGDTIRTYVNDFMAHELVDHRPEEARHDGVLAFQLHTGPPMRVEIKDIELKKLK